jgi:hypothetical protein
MSAVYLGLISIVEARDSEDPRAVATLRRLLVGKSVALRTTGFALSMVMMEMI